MKPYQAIMNSIGRQMPQMPAPVHQAPNAPQPNLNDMLHRLQSDPGGAVKTAGYNVPDELIGNPQATVMHLIQTGQVSSPLMQRITPMLQRMGMR